MTDPQGIAHTHSLTSPTAFWDTHGRQLDWETPYTQPLQHDEASASWTWFPGGKISATYNLITRHVLAGNGERTAIIWDSPVTGMKRRISYRELQEEVEIFAEVLRQRGVGRGDRVLVYSMFSLLWGWIVKLLCWVVGAMDRALFKVVEEGQ